VETNAELLTGTRSGEHPRQSCSPQPFDSIRSSEQPVEASKSNARVRGRAQQTRGETLRSR
jgi:hypothetical protein